VTGNPATAPKPTEREASAFRAAYQAGIEVNTMFQRIAFAAFLLFIASPAAAQDPGDDGDFFYIPSETTVAYVGENYWLRTKLPDNWAYGLSPTEDGMQLMVSRNPEDGEFSSDLITFTEKQAFDDWPEKHEASWAADAYRDWEVSHMQSEGVDKGTYQLRDILEGKTSVGDKTLYTLKYRQLWTTPDGSDLVIHAHLYLFFPEAYAQNHRFYWIHYQHLCEEGEQEQLLLELVDSLLSSLTTDMANAPRQSSVAWMSVDGNYAAINTLGDDRTWYFSNDTDRRCFSFSLDGIWATMNTPGYFIGANGYDSVGVELVGAFELTTYPGNNLVERVINGKRELLQYEATGDVRILEAEDVDDVYRGARKVSYEVPFEALGMATSSITVFYVADVAPGWAALVHASQNMHIGDDDLAHEVFESLRLSDTPGCFREEITELLR
jgi:hypothetical protein